MYDAIILLAGTGTRSQLDYNKVFYTVNDKPLFGYALDVFLADSDCKQVVLVSRADETDFIFQYFDQAKIDEKRIVLATGGETRQESVSNGLEKANAEFVFIHDGARPLIDQELLTAMKKELVYEKAVIVATKVTDTLKQIDGFGDVDKTIDRTKIVQAQTPQAFQTDLIRKGYAAANEEKFVATDCASVIEYMNSSHIRIVEGSRWNIKVTTPEDFDIITYLINKRGVE